MQAAEGTSACNTTRHGSWKWEYLPYKYTQLNSELFGFCLKRIGKKSNLDSCDFTSWNKDQGEYVSTAPVIWYKSEAYISSSMSSHVANLLWKGKANGWNDCKAPRSYTHSLHYFKWAVEISPYVLWSSELCHFLSTRCLTHSKTKHLERLKKTILAPVLLL